MTSLIDLVYVSRAVETFFIFNVNFLKPGTKVPIHNLKIHFHLPPMKIRDNILEELRLYCTIR